jgi:hypothetical protein
MSNIHTLANKLYERFWDDQPLVKAAFYLGLAVAGLKTLDKYSIPEVASRIHEADAQVILLSLLISMYFLLASVFYYEKLQSERKLRRQEESFRYDKRGTLFNGSEPNIAFRVATFKGILIGLAETFGGTNTKSALLEAGQQAATDFAAKLPNIYDTDIQRLSGGKKWYESSFEEQLQCWADYDSATGWGIMINRWDKKNKTVGITILHQHKLVDDEGGALFAHFLAGYCRTVLASIVKLHREGIIGDLEEVQIENIETGGRRAKFLYKLR